MPGFQFCYFLGKFLIVFYSMRTRPNNRHIASQYIKKLRQLIHARLSEKLAYSRDSGVITCCLLCISFYVYDHRSELQTREWFIAFAISFLLEKNRASGIQFNYCRNNWQ